MTQATPNPWWNNPYKPTQILGRSPNPPVIATTLRWEDATLIVRAVNAHDELIAALESVRGRRAHVKRAKHFQAHRHSYVWTYSPPVFVIVIRGEQSVMIRGAARKLINRAHAIRGGYQS